MWRLLDITDSPFGSRFGAKRGGKRWRLRIGRSDRFCPSTVRREEGKTKLRIWRRRQEGNGCLYEITYSPFRLERAYIMGNRKNPGRGRLGNRPDVRGWTNFLSSTVSCLSDCDCDCDYDCDCGMGHVIPSS